MEHTSPERRWVQEGEKGLLFQAIRFLEQSGGLCTNKDFYQTHVCAAGGGWGPGWWWWEGGVMGGGGGLKDLPKGLVSWGR